MENIKPLEWVWKPLIPRNCVSILASRGGVGKSGFALWLANELSREGKTVLYVDAERCGYHIKQRINDWNLDSWKEILFLISDLCDGSVQTAAPSTIVELYEFIKKCSPDLVILDSLTIFARGLDSNRRDVMAMYFEELTKAAVECNTGILILAHTKKKQNNEDQLSLDSIAGSGAITDLARSVMLMDFGSKPDDRIVSQLKINLVAKSQPLKFTMTSTGITNVCFVDEPIIKTGTEAERFRRIAVECIEQGMSLKDTRAILKKEGCMTSSESGRAIKWACDTLNVSVDKNEKEDK